MPSKQEPFFSFSYAVDMSENTGKQRRQRAILSCNDCRRRKLACNRLQPCDRCIKGGIANSCAFGPEAHSNQSKELQSQFIKRRRGNANRKSNARATESLYLSENEHGTLHRTDNNNAGSSEQTPDHGNDIDRLNSLDGIQQDQKPKDQVDFLAKSPELKGLTCSSAVMGMLKGRGYGIHFYGSSAAMCTVAHVSDPSISRSHYLKVWLD